MEVIFLLLSGVILVAGVLYWFWSHLQLTQKKVQLLENAVFELRTMLLSSNRGPPGPSSPELPVVGGSAGNVAAAGYEDLGDDDWDAEEGEKIVDRPDDDATGVPVVAPTTVIREVVEEDAVDLQPGGRILVPSTEEVKEVSQAASTLLRAAEPAEETQFRELFVAKAGGAVTEATEEIRTAESLESMPVKELRRLAQERGIAGAADMRKKEILAALRQQIQSAPAATLDLTKMGVVTEEAEAEAEAEGGIEAILEDTVASENPALE
jgi:hypothetical protein